MLSRFKQKFLTAKYKKFSALISVFALLRLRQETLDNEFYLTLTQWSNQANSVEGQGVENVQQLL